MAAEHHIRENVARYLAHQISLDDFQIWFVPRAWEVLETGAPAAALASQIELLLAEYTNGDRTENELRDALGTFGSVAIVNQASVDAKWEVVTSALSVSFQIHDAPQTENVWLRISDPKEAQAKEPQAA
jgi:hypothetical protein